jgi:hypothetical protein
MRRRLRRRRRSQDSSHFWFIGVGGICEAQGRLDDVLSAFRETLRIMQKLAEQDPTNAGWQRDLATLKNWLR